MNKMLFSIILKIVFINIPSAVVARTDVSYSVEYIILILENICFSLAAITVIEATKNRKYLRIFVICQVNFKIYDNVTQITNKTQHK